MAKEVNEMGYGVVDQFGFPQGTGPEVSCQKHSSRFGTAPFCGIDIAWAESDRNSWRWLKGLAK